MQFNDHFGSTWLSCAPCWRSPLPRSILPVDGWGSVPRMFVVVVAAVYDLAFSSPLIGHNCYPDYPTLADRRRPLKMIWMCTLLCRNFLSRCRGLPRLSRRSFGLLLHPLGFATKIILVVDGNTELLGVVITLIQVLMLDGINGLQIRCIRFSLRIWTLIHRVVIIVPLHQFSISRPLQVLRGVHVELPEAWKQAQVLLLS